jgi:S-adenosylmethionine hydrolase
MVITLTTDFGLLDPFVGIMKGVIAGRAPSATVIDVTHGIPPQDVRAGALVLRHAVPYFPAAPSTSRSSIPAWHGTARALRRDGERLARRAGQRRSLARGISDGVRRIVHLTEDRFFLPRRSDTFHGRDVFAPVAAALATGTAAIDLGTEVHDMVRIDLPVARVDERTVRGEVIYVDRFGNLVTNVERTIVDRIRDRRRPSVSRAARGIDRRRRTAAIAGGAAGAVVNSWDLSRSPSGRVGARSARRRGRRAGADRGRLGWRTLRTWRSRPSARSPREPRAARPHRDHDDDRGRDDRGVDPFEIPRSCRAASRSPRR